MNELSSTPPIPIKTQTETPLTTPNPKPKKQSQISLVAITLTILLAISLGIIIWLLIINKPSVNNAPNNPDSSIPGSGQTETDPETFEPYTNLGVGSELAEDLIETVKGDDDSFAVIFPDNNEVKSINPATYLYQIENTLMNESFSNNYKLAVIAQKIGDDLENDNTIIPATTFNDTARRIFGKTSTLILESVQSCSDGVFQYNPNSQSFIWSNPGGCGGMLIPFHISEIIAARQYENRIEIEEKAAYITFVEIDRNNDGVTNDSEIVLTISSADETRTIANEIPYDTDDDKIINTYFDNLDTYKYTFLLEDNYWIFEKIERLPALKE